MRIFCDSPAYAERLFPEVEAWAPADDSLSREDGDMARLVSRFLGKGPLWTATAEGFGFRIALLRRFAPLSQYDAMLDLARTRAGLPDGLLCLAGAGRGFHGQRGRRWTAEPGNLHLTAFFQLGVPARGFHALWPALAAVSCVEAIDRLKGLRGRAGIKWVNDILIDGNKAAGFLAFSQIRDERVEAALLGIGINVLKAPGTIASPFVSRATCLKEDCAESAAGLEARVLNLILRRLTWNVARLKRGEGPDLVRLYKRRSVVVGRKVRILAEDEGDPGEIAAGVVSAVGDELELYLAGRKDPVRRGRLVFDG
jgi:biotin-(acetyl-CoA carboxylase) ligase